MFCWNDSGEGSNQTKTGLPRLNLNVLAFGPDPEKAPATAASEPEPQNLWTRFRDGPPARPLDADKASRYLDYYARIEEVWPAPALLSSELAAWGGIAGAVPTTPASAWLVPATLLLDPLPLRGFVGLQ